MKHMNCQNNPELHKKKNIPYAGETPLSQTSLSDLEENMLIMGPFGKALKFFGYHQNTHILYFLKNPANRSIMMDIIKGRSKEIIPFFPLHPPKFGPGSLALFTQMKIVKKYLVGAVQFIPIKEKLILTHMIVLPKWRRQGLNSRMIQYLLTQYPDYELYYHNLTQMGEMFMKKFGGKVYPYKELPL